MARAGVVGLTAALAVWLLAAAPPAARAHAAPPALSLLVQQADGWAFQRVALPAGHARTIAQLEGLGVPRHQAWSPLGDRVVFAFSADADLQEVALPGGQVRGIAPPPGGVLWRLAYRPTGVLLAWTTGWRGHRWGPSGWTDASDPDPGPPMGGSEAHTEARVEAPALLTRLRAVAPDTPETSNAPTRTAWMRLTPPGGGLLYARRRNGCDQTDLLGPLVYPSRDGALRPLGAPGPTTDERFVAAFRGPFMLLSGSRPAAVLEAQTGRTVYVAPHGSLATFWPRRTHAREEGLRPGRSR